MVFGRSSSARRHGIPNAGVVIAGEHSMQSILR